MPSFRNGFPLPFRKYNRKTFNNDNSAGTDKYRKWVNTICQKKGFNKKRVCQIPQ